MIGYARVENQEKRGTQLRGEPVGMAGRIGVYSNRQAVSLPFGGWGGTRSHVVAAGTQVTQ